MKKACILFSLLLFVCMPATAQNHEIDSLKRQLSVAKEDANKVKILNALSGDYTYSFADTSAIYARQGLQLAQRLQFKEGEAWCMYNLCGALTTLGNYAAALNFGYKGLSLFKILQDNGGIIHVYSELGLCYREQGDYKQSLAYFREDLRLNRLYPAELFDWITFGTIASVYERNNQLDSALFYAQKAYTGHEDWSGLLYILGAVHAKLRHDSIALAFYKQTIYFAARRHFEIDTIDGYNGIARIFFNEGRTDSAIYYAKQAMGLQWVRVYPISVMNASALLADIYESQQKTDSAFKYLRFTIALKDSLFSQQKTREAESLNFEDQLHQQELAAQQQQNESTLKLYAALAIASIVLVVAFLLYRNNRNKQKAYTLLQKQKQETDTQKGRVEQTLEELKSTQAQLIQSEKMASLGELTAGIAHEIQNPMNFVNNFSEVSIELAGELKEEIDKCAIPAEIKENIGYIVANLVQNQQKINFHGKRADSIVKGMLQHSRTDIVQKEPTDINQLADEYLRLSYHGLRAKDKTFNAMLETSFDTGLPKLNIVSQDIGRVLLNLFTNAFYSVMQKKKAAPADYQPMVSISTQKKGNFAEIRVRDNGMGIPKSVLDKIYNPFFTTKPTGEGTGLGLSLSYEIITNGHAGTLQSETKEGEFAEFTIRLPL